MFIQLSIVIVHNRRAFKDYCPGIYAGVKIQVLFIASALAEPGLAPAKANTKKILQSHFIPGLKPGASLGETRFYKNQKCSIHKSCSLVQHHLTDCDHRAFKPGKLTILKKYPFKPYNHLCLFLALIGKRLPATVMNGAECSAAIKALKGATQQEFNSSFAAGNKKPAVVNSNVTSAKPGGGFKH